LQQAFGIFHQSEEEEYSVVVGAPGLNISCKNISSRSRSRRSWSNVELGWKLQQLQILVFLGQTCSRSREKFFSPAEIAAGAKTKAGAEAEAGRFGAMFIWVGSCNHCKF